MDQQYMKIALDLARAAEGQTAPNPAVGAVIVKDNQIVGLGTHLKAGEPHAERHAILMAGTKAKGSTMYVTLEPCSHFGRTAPCADAVIEAGIKKVFIASTDPNPKVAGGGIIKLRKAGVEVVDGFMKKEADSLNRFFFHYIKTKKPFVTLKSATSIDGKIATKTGESQWITGEEAREDVHILRHKHDAILVGVNTVIIDNPSLTTRLKGGGINPVRVVLDHNLRTPLESKIITDHLAPTWVITRSNASETKKTVLKQAGVKVIEVHGDEIEIPELLQILGENEISSLLVEGGGIINDSFLRSNEFQQVVVYIAPTIIGGDKARSAFSGHGIESLSETPQLEVYSIEKIGKDVKLVLWKEGK